MMLARHDGVVVEWDGKPGRGDLDVEVRRKKGGGRLALERRGSLTDGDVPEDRKTAQRSGGENVRPPLHVGGYGAGIDDQSTIGGDHPVQHRRIGRLDIAPLSYGEREALRGPTGVPEGRRPIVAVEHHPGRNGRRG